jgi:hypothetical protein
MNLQPQRVVVSGDYLMAVGQLAVQPQIQDQSCVDNHQGVRIGSFVLFYSGSQPFEQWRMDNAIEFGAVVRRRRQDVERRRDPLSLSVATALRVIRQIWILFLR